MTASVTEIGEAAFGLIQAGQGGFELGNTSNAYDAYTAGLNLVAGIAGTSPFGVGLNAAATANNTATVVSRFQSGTLQPSDILQLTASGLTLVAAAAAVTGAPITLSAVVLAGVVGMVAGPGPLQSQFNEYANWLGQKMVSGLLGSVPANAGTISDAVGGADGDGQSLVVRQFDINGGEMVTVEYLDRFGISHGEYGTQSGKARVGVGMAGGTMWSDVDSNGQPINSYWVPDEAPNSEYTLPLPPAEWQDSLDKAHGMVEQGFYGANPGYEGNTIDYAATLLEAAGKNYGAMVNYFDPSSLTHDFLTSMDWLNQSLDFYSEWYATGDPDGRAYYELGRIQDMQPILGETEEFEQMEERTANGISSPIVIDLNGDGIHSTFAELSNVKFDITGDGTADKVGWLTGDDAFLAVDRNANGVIDGVGELFGGKDRGVGFARLSELDENKDGALDSSDSDFASLLFWQDKNTNGATDSGELSSAAPLLQSINLAYKTEEIRNSGNLIGEVSSAQLGDSIVELSDIYFRYFDGNRTSGAIKSDVCGSLEDGALGPQIGFSIQDSLATDPSVHTLIASMATFAPAAMDQINPALADQRSTTLIVASAY